MIDDPWQDRNKGMRCKTCTFFVVKTSTLNEPSTSRGPLGRCCRHCPTMSGFPDVFAADWCGEYRLHEDRV